MRARWIALETVVKFVRQKGPQGIIGVYRSSAGAALRYAEPGDVRAEGE